MLLYLGFLKLNVFVTLTEDVIFANGAPLLITMSRGIQFVTVEHIPTLTAKQLNRYLKDVMNIYSISTTIVKNFLMEMDFDKTIEEMMENAIVKKSASKEHVPEIERTIHTSRKGTNAPLKYDFQVPPQDTHHQHCVFFSSTDEHLPR